ncbi:hypothetical protein FSW04_07180 [Baekduia soli]|uniref:DUF4175 domain-containing protein n=1 Tax=Baekduia soli TaxID=496014 RepID=A0A5B8U3G5_9ACTN|nr:hypothetical protein [Baekduia soli]QEC47385.1 hypothetical protein FSW04_07180 [Baekduia soli]
MSALRTARRLLLGETWLLPCGLTLVVAGAVVLVRPLLGTGWRHAGGFVLLAGVCAVLALSVRAGARQ